MASPLLRGTAPGARHAPLHGLLTNKGRLAVAAMIELAMRSETAPVALAVVGERQQISLSYLEQLFGRLRQRALVRGTRGPGGGYSLGRGAAEITVADIIAAVDDPVAMSRRRVQADTGAGTPTTAQRMTQDLWDAANASLADCLTLISLKTLVEAHVAKGSLSERASIRRGISTRPVLKPVQMRSPNSVFALADA